MLTYSAKEIKAAILKWSPAQVDFTTDEFEQIKWEMIFAKYIDLETNKEHFIRIN